MGPMKVLGMVEVPNTWYPVSFAIGYSLINGGIQWDSFAAVAFGYTYRFLKLQWRLLLSRRRAQELEFRWNPPLPGLISNFVGGRWLLANNILPGPNDGRDDGRGGREDRRDRHDDGMLPRGFQ